MSARLVWLEGRLVAGHGVASGRAAGSPYPAGTIALQAPLFRARGVDLSPYRSATLNLDFSPGEWRLRDPDHHVPHLAWSDRHPPETFSFWRCRLRRGGAPGAADVSATAPEPEVAAEVAALIYHPHPETKRAHHQSPSLLEVLAPPLPAVSVGERFALGLDPGRCRLIQPARLRARLLEFLKFRVLAAQEEFFAAPPDPVALRCWLAPLWPEACDLSDGDLLATLEQARFLYTETPRRGGP
ncbi:MAG: hypothetical protein RLZZ124_97 [Cyanobacteriota bacterium]